MALMSWVAHPFKFQSTDGLTLAGERAGPSGAQPVILMHGGGQTRHSWRRAVRELAARGYDVINLDARGHGDSQWAPAPSGYGMDHLADDLLQVIDSLQRPPVLIGASMGGLTALHAIGRYPQRVLASAMILVDVVPRVEAEGARRVLDFMNANPDGFASIDEAAAAVAAYNPHRPKPSSAEGLMKNLRRDDRGRLRWHWDPQFASEVITEGLIDTDDMLNRCRHFQAPSLLVRGLQSDIVSEAGIEELRRALPQLEVADVSGAGHMIAGDRNDAFNAAVLAFLSKLPAAGGHHEVRHEQHG
jgi:pimeloyl-ACP methyl ester carboxylesterase